MKVKYIIPEGYEIDRRGKRKPLREYVETDFEGLYYNGEIKKFARYYVFEESEYYWFLDRHEIGDDVFEGHYSKADDRLWPPHHITKLKKIKKDNVKDE